MPEMFSENGLHSEEFHKVYPLIDQLSDRTPTEVANQLSDLVNTAESGFKEEICNQIARLLFARATREAADPFATQLCARLCHRLKINDSESGGDRTLFNASALVHKGVYRLCNGVLEQTSRRTQRRTLDAGRDSTRTPVFDRVAPERVTLFIGELFEAKVISAALVQDYLKRLINSQNSISLESRLLGLSQLMETHGRRLDAGPWKDGMDLIFAWIDGVTEGARMAKRVDPQLLDKLKAVTELRSQNWSERGIHGLWRRGYIGGGFIPQPPRWDTFVLEPQPRKVILGNLGEDVNPQLVAYAWDISIKCKVGALLNKITRHTFDSISDQVVLYAELSEFEATGSILLLLIQAIVDKARAGEAFSGVYAKLCRKLRDRVSPRVQVDTSSNGQRQLVSGSAFFEGRLLRLCQIEFERRWLAAYSGQQPIHSHQDELYTAVKIKRQRVGIARFIGELFRAGVANEAILRRCITMLLWSTVSPEVLLDTATPEEEMLECVCVLLSVAGKELDRGETQKLVDGYFKRIVNLASRDNVCFRMRFMLQDIIELRERSWQARKRQEAMERSTMNEPKEGSSTRTGVEVNAKANTMAQVAGKAQEKTTSVDTEVRVKATFEIGSAGASGAEIGVARISTVRPDLHTNQAPSLTIRPPIDPRFAPPHLPWAVPPPAPFFHPAFKHPHVPFALPPSPFTPSIQRGGTFSPFPPPPSSLVARNQAIRLNTPDGTPLTFGKVASALSPVPIGAGQRQKGVVEKPSLPVRLETPEQKAARLSKIKEGSKGKEKEEHDGRESTGAGGIAALNAQAETKVGGDITGDQQGIVSSTVVSELATARSVQDGTPDSLPKASILSPTGGLHEYPTRTPIEQALARQRKRSTVAAPMLPNIRIIEDLNAVPYPESVMAPDPDLNIGAGPGKFRYKRQFLLQFRDICKQRPIWSVPLDTLGLGSIDPELNKGDEAPGSKNIRLPSTNRAASGSQNPAGTGFGLGFGSMSQGQKRAVVTWEVKKLLKTLSRKRLYPVSEKLIEWANRSEQETDADTLGQVTWLVCSKARNEPTSSKHCAKLCQIMSERISPNVRDEAIRDAEGQLVTGAALFRRFLLHLCESDFAGEWPVRRGEVEGQTNEAENNMDKPNYPSLGMVRFVGELFRLGMVRERIMHECIKVLLKSGVDSDEQEIEKLCTLMTMVGESLDATQARGHMDMYFERIQDMAKVTSISPGTQQELQDIIELRASQWQVLPAAAAASGEESEHREPLASTVATASEVGVLEETNTDTKEYPARRPDEPEQQPEQTEHKSVERQEENTSGEHAEAEETPRFDREAKGKGRAKEDEEREEEERVREGQESVKWEGMEPESEPKGAEPIVRITADAELGTDVTRAEVESEVVNGGQIAAEAEDAAATGQDALSPTDSPRFTWGGSLPSAVSKHSSRHSVSDTTSERPEHPFCDLLHPIPAQRFGDAAPLTAFASVRIIEDLNTVPYPATIERPNPDLNIGTIPGKFRYERDFLLQFMNVCTKRPDSLPALDAIGLNPSTGPDHPSSARKRARRAGSLSKSGAPGQQHQTASGLGLGNISLAKGGLSLGSPLPSPSFKPSMPELEENWRASGGAENRLSTGEARALVDQSFKPLLDSLTRENFNWTSKEITDWMKKGEESQDASELKRAVELICEKVQSEEASSKTCALLCQKMMKHISPTMQDETVRNLEGEPFVGSALFQKYLLNRCQGDFRRRWSTKHALSAPKTNEDQESVGGENEEAGEEVLQRDEDDAFDESKRQWLGTVRFIGELFRLRMLTARMMHTSIMKLLSNADEQDIEGLSTLMKIAGPNLERLQSWNHMDVYFERMQDIIEGSDASSRTKDMLKELVELRQEWKAQIIAPQLPTLAVEGQDGSDEAVSNPLSQPNEPPKDERPSPQADGISLRGSLRSSRSIMRPPARVGGLLQFGKVSEPTVTLSVGSSTVSSKEAVAKQEGDLPHESSPASLHPLGIMDSPPTEPAAQDVGSPRSSANLGLGDEPAAAEYAESLSKRLGSLSKTEEDPETEGTDPGPSAGAAATETNASQGPMKGIISRFRNVWSSS